MKRNSTKYLKNQIILALVLSFAIYLWPMKITAKKAEIKPIASRQMSLEKRYNDSFVNGVFKDNILLTMAYLSGKILPSQKINWTEINKPFTLELTLNPGQVFAFHNDVLPQYKGQVKYTTNAHFNSMEGFKSDGYLVGDGVCHLASLINWVAQEAKLEVVSPTNHDFAVIPEVPKKYGTSIYNTVGQESANALQNLYIKNNRSSAIKFVFNYDKENLKLSIVESKSLLSKR